MYKSYAAKSPKAWWHSVKLHKCIWRGIPVLVLILIPNKNPISKSIKNYFDLRNLGIIANVKTLSLRARFLFILFLSCHHWSTPQTSSVLVAMPQMWGMKELSPQTTTIPVDLLSLRDLLLGMDNQKWMKNHFSKAIIICPQKLWKSDIKLANQV